jgi:hypothetical protein
MMEQQPKSKRDEVLRFMLWIIDKFSLKKHQKWNFDSNQKENKANLRIAFLCLDIVEYINELGIGRSQIWIWCLLDINHLDIQNSNKLLARTLNKSKPWWFYRRKTCSNFFRKEFSQTQNLADFSIS